MKNKKTTVAIISVIALVLVIIGVTYAYWLVTKTQTNENKITTGCLDITIDSEANDITLTNQFPLSDVDGMKLTPYEFTVTNNCTTSVDYQVNLESLDSENLEEISTSSIKIALFKEGTDVTTVTPALLSSYEETTTTVTDALSANKLLIDTLAGKVDGSTDNVITYNLLLWIDADAPISEQSKGFTSKISVTVGQGIENKVLLRDAILANYGGASAITTISTDVEEKVWTSGDVTAWASSNYYWASSYTLDKETGQYTLAGNIVKNTPSTCKSDETVCEVYTLLSSLETTSSNLLYKVTNFTSTKGTNYIVADTYAYSNLFGVAPTEETSGIYKMNDDYGQSYYFRGMVENNYVQLGTIYEEGFTGVCINGYCSTDDNGDLMADYSSQEDCIGQEGPSGIMTEDECVLYDYESQYTPMYWQIVRFNGDGTIRLVYAGNKFPGTGELWKPYINDSTAYNSLGDNAKYVGYTYDVDGTETDSIVKSELETWYVANLENDYGQYIADSIFCNDRSDTNNDGYYDSYDRLAGFQIIPSLTCSNDNDKYTKSNLKGNGLLKSSIGLLTADEFILAGSTYGTNNRNNYLYTDGAYWTMTPYSYTSDKGAYVWRGNDIANGGNSWKVTTANLSIRPVINLRADVTFTGDGSFATPYEIVMN